MKKLRFVYLIDFLLVFFALAFPVLFVEKSSYLFNSIFALKIPSFGFAYALIITFVCFFAGLLRGCRKNIATHRNSSIWINSSIIIVAIFMFVNATENPATSAAEAMSPYISYVLTVLFFMGVGYCMVDIVCFFNER